MSSFLELNRSFLSTNESSIPQPLENFETSRNRISASVLDYHPLLSFHGEPLDSVPSEFLHRAWMQVGLLIGAGKLRGTATLISPKHILVAFHVLKFLSVSDLLFTLQEDGVVKEYTLKLVEDGTRFGLDYAIFECQREGNFLSYARMTLTQELNTFLIGSDSESHLRLFAETKAISPYNPVVEYNNSPTKRGMSGACYRNANNGKVYAFHIKQVVRGMFVGENTGVLIKSIPLNTIFIKIVTTKWSKNPNATISTVAFSGTFPFFSTAKGNEIDQGLTQCRDEFTIYKGKYFFTNHLMVGVCQFSAASLPTFKDEVPVPLVIEVMETSVDSAKKKIQQLATFRSKQNPIALVIMLNNIRYSNPENQLDCLTCRVKQICEEMTSLGIYGCCFPVIWKKTGKESEEGYIFPYLEARSMLVLHPDVKQLHDVIKNIGTPVIRWMDGDVEDDFLFRTNIEDDLEERFQKNLKKLATGELSILTGGYRWDSEGCLFVLNGLDKAEQNGEHQRNLDTLLPFFKGFIQLLNKWESLVRAKLVKYGVKCIYWPEPNLYLEWNLRLDGGVKGYERAKKCKDSSQQRESTDIVKCSLANNGQFREFFSTTKPLKPKFFSESFRELLSLFQTPNGTNTYGSITLVSIKAILSKVHQTHLNSSTILRDLADWHEFVPSDLIKGICDNALHQCALEYLEFLYS